MRVVFVHGACVKDGSWWWHRTGDMLAEHGVASEAPVLPSCGETGDPVGFEEPGLAEDVASVRRVLTASDEPTIVVAHSYGGVLTAEAAVDAAAVRHVLLISSYLAEAGESLSSFGGDTPPPFLDVDPDAGTFGVRGDLFADTFMHDCRELAGEAAARLTRQGLKVTQQPVQAAVWGSVPTTYLVCAGDRGTPAERQREFARRADRVVETDAGHHPFLSRPAEVCELIVSL